MAAYAALVSLEHIIDNLEHHSRPPITLHNEKAHILTQKLTFLQDFLQVYNPNLPYSKEADPLESRIARAAYAAEDAIESHILDQYTDSNGEKMSSDGLYKALEKVIADMALIEKEATEINKQTGQFQNQLQAKSTTDVDPSGSSSSGLIEQKMSMMVGADDVLLELKDKLTSNRTDLQTIPIVGMGGSGKTTLALNIFQDRLIEEHFDIRAWVTISQEYSVRQTLVRLLTQLIKDFDKELSEGELGEMLYKHLFGRRYMIVLDDVWSIEACDVVMRFLPNNSNGSRIVITTRITTVASTLSNSNSIGMKLLDEDDSWDLLSKTVFGVKCFCPLELEEVGKKIGKSCKGLPLSIVVIGGLLSKSEQTIEFWGNMAENLNAIVNLDDGERCLKTLYMSYKHLPVHLKPCFLYMGIYREDHEIRISYLVRLWVAEGFLKPIRGKRPEEVSRVYLKDLIDRNLILVHKMGSIGSIKECKVHDLLRDLCLREAQKEGFYTIYPGHEIGNKVTRIVCNGTVNEIEEINACLSSAPLARSLISDGSAPLARSLILDGDIIHGIPPQIFRLTRILHCEYSEYESGKFLGDNLPLVNSRFLKLHLNNYLSSSICLSWNLHTLIVNQVFEITVPADIWYMSHIRHLHFDSLSLPDPSPNVEADGIVLQNLQTLGKIKDLTWSEEVVKRIPNVRKLRIYYSNENRVIDDRFCLTNLDHLDKLESLTLEFDELKCQINYPQSLKKLRIRNEYSSWHHILDKIGALPLLEKLALVSGKFEWEWETTDGQFRSLKFLSIHFCRGLHVWTSEASHFPRLERLHVDRVDDLEEIPSDFADISTLRLIEVSECGDQAVKSAKRILEEQEDLYGEDETTLQFEVVLSEYNDRALERLGSHYFRVIGSPYLNETSSSDEN